MNPYRFTHLSGRCRGGGDRTGFIVHLVPSSAGSMGSAACGKKPSPKSNGWSEHDDDKLTCPRCIEIATSEPLPEYTPVIGSGHINKIKFYWGEETYTLCVTKDDWWVEDVGDMPERMITYANELALENGMDEVTKPLPNSLCPTCKDGVLATVVGNYTLKSVARLGGKSLVLKDIIRDECPKCGEMIFPWQSCKKIDDSVAALASQNETLPP